MLEYTKGLYASSLWKGSSDYQTHNFYSVFKFELSNSLLRIILNYKHTWEDFPKRPSGAPRHICPIIWCFRWFCALTILRQCLALVAVVGGWMLFDISLFACFLENRKFKMILTQLVKIISDEMRNYYIIILYQIQVTALLPFFLSILHLLWQLSKIMLLSTVKLLLAIVMSIIFGPLKVFRGYRKVATA